MAAIRLGDPARDSRQVAAIYYPYVINTPVTFESDPPTGSEMSRRMEKVLEEYPWLICEEGQEIMGYSYGSRFRDRPAYDWIVETTIYVKESAHGLGIGLALYTSLIEYLRLQGYCSAVGVIALPNLPSINLHERLGFKKCGLLANAGFKDGAWHTVGLWQLTLQPNQDEPYPPIDFPATTHLAEFTTALKSGEPHLKF